VGPASPGVTARAEIPAGAWTDAAAFAIFLVVTFVQLLEFLPSACFIFGAPALVWMWGRAIEQLAVGIERLDGVIERLRAGGGGNPGA
jgi:hypothetical protein